MTGPGWPAAGCGALTAARAWRCWTRRWAATRRCWSRPGWTWPGCAPGPPAARRCPPLWREPGPARRAARPAARPGPAGSDGAAPAAGRAARRRPGPGAGAIWSGRTRRRCSGIASAEAVEPGRAFKRPRVRLADRGGAAEPADTRRPGCGCPPRWCSTTPPRWRWPVRLRAELLGGPGPGRRRPRPWRSAAGEPVAIVGMGCRFPGGAASPEELWDLLAAGGDAISELPGGPGLGCWRAV